MSYKIWTNVSDETVKQELPIAGFDMDWTLIYCPTSLFAHSENDYKFLPYRLERLSYCVEEGFQVVIFTNQKYKGVKRRYMEKRCENVFNDIVNFIGQHAPVTLIASFEDDIYRKPNVGMWSLVNLDKMSQDNKSLSFYCGDADGSAHSFSDSDKRFAENVNVKFFSVYSENIFPTVKSNKECYIPDEILKSSEFDRKMIILMYISNTDIEPLLQAIPQTFKTVTRITFKENDAISGRNLTINGSNASFSERNVWYNIAQKYNYRVITLFYIKDISNVDKSNIILHGWFKRYREDPPSDKEDIVSVW